MSELEDRIAAREKTLASDIEGRIAAREAELSKNETPTPFLDQVGKTFANNALAAIPAAGEVLSKGVAGTEAALEGGVSVMTGGDFDFERRANRNMQFPPFAQLNNIPRPTINEVGTAIREAPESIANLPLSMGRQVHVGSDLLGTERQPNIPAEPFSGRFDDELASLNQEQERVAEKFPFETRAGQVVGDALTLMTGRAPLARGINAAEKTFIAKKFSESMTEPSIRKAAENVWDSKAVRSLLRGTGRAVETGVEASVLSILNGNDPVETAAFAVGGQLGGSAAIKIGEGLLSGGPTQIGAKILLASVSFGALIQMGKQTIPGGAESEIVELLGSMSEGFDKVQISLILGALSTAAGAGRLRSSNMPEIADAIATLPRAASISMLGDYLRASSEEQQTIDATLKQLQQDPDFFGPEITEKLNSGLENGKLVEILREPF